MNNTRPKAQLAFPMRGKSLEEVLFEWERWKDLVSDRYDVIDSICKEHDNADHNALWYLGYSLQCMADADVLVLCRGWSNADGCAIEAEAAMRYGKSVETINEKGERESLIFKCNICRKALLDWLFLINYPVEGPPRQ